MTDPFRDRPLSAAEVRRVLARALQLAGSGSHAPHAERATTLADLEQHALALGLPPAAVARAVAEWRVDPRSRASQRSPWELARAPLRITRQLELPGEPPPDLREGLADLLRAALGVRAAIEPAGEPLSFRVTSAAKRRAGHVLLTFRLGEGRTRVQVEQRLGAAAAWVAAQCALGFLFMLGGFVEVWGGPPPNLWAASLPLLWLALAVLFGRWQMGRVAVVRARAVDAIVDGVEQVAARWAPARGGVAAGGPTVEREQEAELRQERSRG